MSKSPENFLNNQHSNSQTTNTSAVDQEPNLMNIFVSALTPLIPVVLAKVTGQKLPTMNAVSDNQPPALIQQLTMGFQTMINNQNLLIQEIVALKNNAQSLANNFHSLTLTHEKKQIGFNTNTNLDNHE
jgi:hypothetical protein